MILLRLLPPSCLLLILYLRLVEFPLRWKLPFFSIFFKTSRSVSEDTAIDIYNDNGFSRSPTPIPDGGPDLFYQPLDKSQWTMLDIRWDQIFGTSWSYFMVWEVLSQEDGLFRKKRIGWCRRDTQVRWGFYISSQKCHKVARGGLERGGSFWSEQEHQFPHTHLQQGWWSLDQRLKYTILCV